MINLLKIKQINEDLNSQLPEEEISRNINWKLKKPVGRVPYTFLIKFTNFYINNLILEQT